jgi:hypothetical protein
MIRIGPVPAARLVDEQIRPLCDLAVAGLWRSSGRGRMAGVAPAHLSSLLTGAGATLFVLAPEGRRLAGIDPAHPAVVRTHADAVVALLFGDGA